jgi:hypothetical protein
MDNGYLLKVFLNDKHIVMICLYHFIATCIIIEVRILVKKLINKIKKKEFRGLNDDT